MLKEETFVPMPRLTYVRAQGCETCRDSEPPVTGHWVRFERSVVSEMLAPGMVLTVMVERRPWENLTGEEPL